MIYKVLIADRLGFMDIDGRGIQSQVSDYIESKQAFFHMGSASKFEKLDKGIHFFYMPELDEAGIAREAIPNRYHMVNLAATKVPEEANFPMGGVRWGAGVNNFPENKWREAKIPIMNVPAGNSTRTALTWLDALIAVAVDLDIREVAKRTVCDNTFSTNQINDYPTGGLQGKKLAILGITGNIGHEVKNIAQALRMKISGWSPSFRPCDAENMGVEFAATMEQAASNADILSLHFPYKTSVNEKIIGSSIFQLMKKNGIIINFARGELIDTSALDQAMSDGQIAKIAVDADIFRNNQILIASPLKPYLNLYSKYPNRMLLLPHIATDTDHETRVALVMRGIDQTLTLLREKKIINGTHGDLPRGYINAGQQKPSIGKISSKELLETLEQNRQKIEKLAKAAQKFLTGRAKIENAIDLQNTINILAIMPTTGRAIDENKEVL